MVDREIRWAAWLSIAAGLVCGLIAWSLLLGFLAAVGVRLGIEAMTSIWEEVEFLRGNDPYADRRAESELLREERLRNERHRDERWLALRSRCRRLLALARRRGRKGSDREEEGPSNEA